MSYLLTRFWPGGTEEQYQATLAAATEAAWGSIPETFHAACVTDGGVLVVATYELAHHFALQVFVLKLQAKGCWIGRKATPGRSRGNATFRLHDHFSLTHNASRA
jgi:hypothetical protein